MERRWLNPNQLKYRIRAARGIFDDLQAKQIMEILQQSGAADEVAPFFGGEAPAEKPADASIDELAEHAMRAGLQRADAAMVRIWEAQKARQDSVQAFNVQVDVTDYRIADPSLRRIVLEADVEPIREIIDAAIERSEIDGCPPTVWMPLSNARQVWLDWAKEGLKPRKTADA
jgi:hypothetical protein